MDVRIRRVYEKLSKDDGKRILVDRLWPRGLTKEKAKIDLWIKDIAPSAELRKWFNHDPAKWPEFKKKYLSELKGNGSVVEELIEQIKAGKVTLVYAAKNEDYNDAVVLKEYLEEQL